MPRRSSAPQALDILRISARTALERRGAGDENIGARRDHGARGLLIDAAIDFEIDPPAAGVDAPAQGADLLELLGDETLSAEARVHRHHEHEIDVTEEIIHHLDRRARIERHAGALAQRLDQLERAMRMRPRLGMDRDDVSARGRELRHESIDRGDHEMHVERKRRAGSQGLYDHRADREVGDEMAVHHVDMNPIGAGRGHGAHLLAQPREIGREDRRGYARRLLHVIRRLGS